MEADRLQRARDLVRLELSVLRESKPVGALLDPYTVKQSILNQARRHLHQVSSDNDRESSDDDDKDEEEANSSARNGPSTTRHQQQQQPQHQVHWYPPTGWQASSHAHQAVAEDAAIQLEQPDNQDRSTEIPTTKVSARPGTTRSARDQGSTSSHSATKARSVPRSRTSASTPSSPSNTKRNRPVRFPKNAESKPSTKSLGPPPPPPPKWQARPDFDLTTNPSSGIASSRTGLKMRNRNTDLELDLRLQQSDARLVKSFRQLLGDELTASNRKRRKNAPSRRSRYPTDSRWPRLQDAKRAEECIIEFKRAEQDWESVSKLAQLRRSMMVETDAKLRNLEAQMRTAHTEASQVTERLLRSGPDSVIIDLELLPMPTPNASKGVKSSSKSKHQVKQDTKWKKAGENLSSQTQSHVNLDKFFKTKAIEPLVEYAKKEISRAISKIIRDSKRTPENQSSSSSINLTTSNSDVSTPLDTMLDAAITSGLKPCRLTAADVGVVAPHCSKKQSRTRTVQPVSMIDPSFFIKPKAPRQRDINMKRPPVDYSQINHICDAIKQQDPRLLELWLDDFVDTLYRAEFLPPPNEFGT
ncbi:hypothetical protein SeLEV6574_g06747 [Synchytrium endobioticum]|uniref:Uncharacterized protein n=1 Tax=Synchytrium endobioticum TaxID=286115 RepID=A0A507CGC8_9FUNG|nr:hypothetical protein SeLEV6574_g06747 [Synchytrium endobioticum]